MHPKFVFKLSILITSLLLYTQSGAQEVEGLWVGSLKTKGTNVHYELWIAKEKENYTGYALSLMVIDGVENIGVKTLKLKFKNNVLLLEDENLVYNNFKTPPKKSKLIARLQIKGLDGLNGTFNTRSLDFTDRTSYEGDVELVKRNESDNSFLLSKLAQLNIITDAAITAGRETQTKENNTIPPNEVIKVSEPTKTETTVANVSKINKEETDTPRTIDKPVVEIKPAEVVVVPTKADSTIANVSKTNKIETDAPKTINKPVVETKPVEVVVVPTKAETTVANVSKINKLETDAPKTINKPAVETKPATAIKVFDPFENRKIEIIETVFVSLDSVKIALYDNGIVDGDTVSIYVNGKLHLEKKELNTTAIRSTIFFPSSQIDSLEIIMYAENLGSLPPNTGLLIIEDGNNRHEIRFSGDLQKNAAILLRRKK